MLLARYAPIGSPRYEKLSKTSEKWDKIIEWLSPKLFAVWSIFVTGMSAGKANFDRHYFWDGSDWLIGIIGLATITIILNMLANKYSDFENDMASPKSIVIFIISSLIILYLGNISVGSGSYTKAIFYILPIIAIYLIHTIRFDINSSLITKESNKHVKTIGSLLLLIVSINLGIVFDDPVLATASIVSLPFLLVLLFGKHVRHLERAKFYPIFIFMMFVCSREAWFLIPVFLLFFILRSYNYLRHQKIYPTFGVSE